MYDWSKDKIEKYLHQEGKNGVVYIEYSYRQIGLTDEWFRKISEKIGNHLTVRREILLQRLRGSSQSPYDRDDIDRIIDLAKKPIESLMLNDYYKLDIYERLNRSIPYLVGIDCATGSNGDSNAMTIINPYTLNVCAEFECNYVGEPEFIACIKELTMKHIPRAILCIERNHVGDAVISFLLQSPIAGRIYYDKYKEIAEKNMEELGTVESVLKKKASLKTYYGVFTQGKSREAMFSILANWVKNHKENFVGQNITRDISKLIQKGGKIQAASGFHDDSIMSLLIALYVYYHGNNLEVFGYTKGDELFLTEKNAGMYNPESIDTSDMSEDVKGFVQQKVIQNSSPDYQTLLRETLMREQQKAMQLTRKGLIENATYENTIKQSSDDCFEDFSDSFDLDFFNEINGF